MNSCCVCLNNVLVLNKLSKKDKNLTLLSKLIISIPEIKWTAKYQICQPCTNLLGIVYTFRETCLKSDLIRKQQIEELSKEISNTVNIKIETDKDNIENKVFTNNEESDVGDSNTASDNEFIDIKVKTEPAKGKFPSEIKLSIVTPVYKKGDKKDLSNYRPIHLLTTFSKILENAINTQLLGYLKAFKLISDNQHGYLKSKGADTAVNNFVGEIYKSVDKKKHCLGLLVDFSKEFDCISHELLTLKLYGYGINN